MEDTSGDVLSGFEGDIVERLAVLIGAEYVGFKGLGKMVGEIKEADGAWNKLKQSATLGGLAVGGATATLGIASFKAATAADTAAGRFRATTLIGKREFDAYHNYVVEKTAGLMQSQTTMYEGLQKAMPTAKSMGYSTQVVEDLTTKTAKLADVWHTNLATGVARVTPLLRDFHVAGRNVNDFMNTLAATMRQSGQGFSIFSGGAYRAALALHQAGAGYRQSFGLIAALAPALGPSAGRSLSQLGLMVTRWQHPTTAMAAAALGPQEVAQLRDAIRQQGYTGGQATALYQQDVLRLGTARLRQVADPRHLQQSIRRILAMQQSGQMNTQSVNALLGPGISQVMLRELATTRIRAPQRNEVQRAFAQYSTTPEAQMRKFHASIEEVEVAIGTGLVPLVNAVVPPITKIALRFQEWADKNPKLVRQLMEVGLGIGLLSAGLRGLHMILGPFNLLIQGSTFLARGLATGFTGIYQGAQLVGRGVTALPGTIRVMTGALQDTIMAGRLWLALSLQRFRAMVVEQVQNVRMQATYVLTRARMLAAAAAQRIVTAAQWAMNVAMEANPIGLVVVALVALGVGLVVLYNKWKPFHQFVNAAFGRLKDFASWLGHDFLATLRNVATNITTWATNVWKGFTGLLNNMVSWVKNNWQTLILVAFTGVFGLIYIFFGKQIASMVKAGKNVVANMATGVKDNAGALKDALVHAVGKALSAALDQVKKHNPFDWMSNHVPTFGLSIGGGAGITGPSQLGAAMGMPSGGPFVNSGNEPGNRAMYAGLGIGYKGTLQDWDYSGPSSRVNLPGGRNARYTFMRSLTQSGAQGHMGTALFFRTANGGIFQVNHMMGNTVPNLHTGQTLSGGSFIGMSGYSSGVYGSGYHLCVVTDALGRSYLMQVSTDQLRGTTPLKGGGGFTNLLNRASKQFNLPPAILASVMQQESGGRNYQTSGAGAMGLMQLLPGTFRAQGVGGNIWDPGQNITAGAKYLASLYYGPAHRNWMLALAMYNAGPAAAASTIATSESQYSAPILQRASGSSGGGGAVTVDRASAPGGVTLHYGPAPRSAAAPGTPAARLKPQPVAGGITVGSGTNVVTIPVNPAPPQKTQRKPSDVRYNLGTRTNPNWIWGPPHMVVHGGKLYHEAWYQDPKTGGVHWIDPFTAAPHATVVNVGTAAHPQYELRTQAHTVWDPNRRTFVPEASRTVLGQKVYYNQFTAARAAQAAAQHKAEQQVRDLMYWEQHTGMAGWQRYMTQHRTPWNENQQGQQTWLRGQYRIAQLRRAMADQRAWEHYMAGPHTAARLQQYQHTVGYDRWNAARGYQSEVALLHRFGYRPGSAGHVLALRQIGHTADAHATHSLLGINNQHARHAAEQRNQTNSLLKQIANGIDGVRGGVDSAKPAKNTGKHALPHESFLNDPRVHGSFLHPDPVH